VFLPNQIYALNVGMFSKLPPLGPSANGNASRGNFSQLPPPGPSANSSTNGNGNLENELGDVSPQVGPAEAGASPSLLRLAAPSRHSALSTSGNIVERERRLREGSFSSTGPVAFIAERGGSGGSAFRAVGAGGGIELDLGLGGAAGAAAVLPVVDGTLFRAAGANPLTGAA
jgi:hypothetical protein